MFNENEIEVKLDWDNVNKYRGQHDILKEFFVDKDAKSYAFVSNGKYVITRDYHQNINAVTFSVFERPAFIWQSNKYLNESGEMSRYWANRNK